MLLDGIHVPLTTPFYPDGRVYLRKLEHNVRRCSLTPVNGLIALGSVSEAESLNDEERLQVLRVVGAEAAKEKVLFAGLHGAGVHSALQQADAAAKLGFDAVLLGVPLAYAQTFWHEGDATPELLTYFEAIADGASLPVVLVSEAGARALPLAVVARLSAHPNVIGLLEQSAHFGRVAAIAEATAEVRRTVTVTTTFTAATGRMVRLPVPAAAVGGTFVSAASLGGGVALATAPPVAVLKTRTKEVGFQVLWGSAAGCVEALRAGAVGLAPALAAAVPEAAFEIWAAWKDGDESLMQGKQARLAHAEQGIASHDIAAIKAGAELSGYFGGRPRLPLLAPAAARQAEIVDWLDGMRS